MLILMMKIKTIQGIGVSRGTVKGKALVMDSMAGPQNLSGYILVTRHATPDLLPYIVHAIGVVCCSGGRLSHMALLCRELCIPCVTGVISALDDIDNNALIEIDGISGSVIIWSNS